jgi:hypothetical protein
VRRSARGRERIDPLAAREDRAERNEIRRRNAVDDQRAMPRGIRAHVLQRMRLRPPLEALEERHVARQVRNLFGGDATTAIHSGQVVDAVLAMAAHALSDDVPGADHPPHFLLGALEDRATGVTDDGVERVAETIGRCRLGGIHRSIR